MPILSKSRLILQRHNKIPKNISKTPIILTNNRLNFSTNPHPKYTEEEIKERLQHANDQRKLYKKQVSELRKQYKQELDVKRREEEREQQKISTKQAIEVAHRRKVKLLRSIGNERKQRELQAERRAEFEEYLRMAQVNREARRERFVKARRLVIEDLEKESHLWMSSVEEVDKVFDDKNIMQELWTHPYTVGARPKDSVYWRFQSRTADMSRSYPKRREMLLDQILDDVHADENIDPEYWTNEKFDTVFQREQRVKLQAMIRKEGRKRLLKQQHELMKEHFTLAPNQKEAGVPLKLPPPDLSILSDEKMMEEEGLKALFESPESFFHMEDGKVIAVKDEFADLPDGRPYPLFIADDTPLVKKKKKPEPKSKKQGKKESPAEDMEAESVDEYMDESSPDYLKEIAVTEVSNDAIPEDEDLFIPEEQRFTERDVDWVAEKLQTKITYYQQLEARDSKDQAKQQYSQANTLGTRLPTAAQQAEKQVDETPTELNFQEVANLVKSLTSKQRDAMEDLNVDKLLLDPEVSMEYVVSCVANITDGRYGGTRLSREQVTTLVEAEYALVMNPELADELMVGSGEVVEDGEVEDADSNDEVDDGDVGTLETGDSATDDDDDKDSK